MAFHYSFVSQGRAPEKISPRAFLTMLVSEDISQAGAVALVGLAEKNCRLQAALAGYENPAEDVFVCEVIPGHFVTYEPAQVTPETHEQLPLPMRETTRRALRDAVDTRKKIDRMRAASGERDDD